MIPKEFLLGRNPSPLDIRDYRLGAFMPMALGDLSGEMIWPFNAESLDQSAGQPEEKTGHCGGFGLADFGINDPVQDNYTNADGHKFYYMCKDFDLEPGMEDGTCIRSVAKVGQKIGRFDNYAFAASVDEITYWLLNKGPVIVGTDWTEGMFSVDENNIIHPTGAVKGGHCYVLKGKLATAHYRIRNSWDDLWGIDGEADISIADFADLLADGGEAVTAVELPLGALPTPQSKGCNFILSQILASLGQNRV